MIYTEILLELAKEKNYKENIELLTIAIIREMEDNPSDENISKAKYYLKSFMQAAKVTAEKEKKDFFEYVLSVLLRKENLNVTVD